MTEQQLRRLSPTLDRYLAPCQFCCAYTQTFAHLNTYVRGLLSDLPRKTAEPIALRGGTAVRTLQEFLKDHHWDAPHLRDDLQAHTADVLDALPDEDLGCVGVIDETSAVKDGTKTPGVQRLYLGCVGKVDNGIVTVHLGVSKGGFKTLVDTDLFLPPEWSDDRDRCRAAGIPDDLVPRPKWHLALGQIDRARANGLWLDWLTFDEEYGEAPGFVAGLDDAQLWFVGEVPRTFSCLAAHRSGRAPQQQTKGRPAEEVVRSSSSFLGQPWQVLRLGRQTEQDQIWRVKAARVWLHSGQGWSAGTYWLIWASNDQTGEEKFFLSNASPPTPVEVMVRVAFRRATVEHSFRIGKSELGFTHFEGRNYVALQRHLTLCLAAMGFVAEHTERLRGEKPGGDDGAGVPGAGGGVPGLAAAAAADDRPGVCAAGHQLPPGAQPGSPRGEAETAGRGRDAEETPAATQKKTKTINGSFKVALYC